MKESILFFLIGLLTAVQVRSQGLIVNEISQGPNLSKEFIELLVVGSDIQKTGTIDISNWIVDDNNGDFKLVNNTAPGIATGHFRFVSNDTTQNISIGTLIVLYNAADKDPAWTFPKLKKNGEDSTYVMTNTGGTQTLFIPGTSTLLRAVSLVPNNASGAYAYTTSTIPPTTQNWNGELGLANTGDAIQTRKPDGTFYHGFGFSMPTQTNVLTSFPTFDEVGLPSFNAYKGVATGMDTYFTCGSWYFATPYLTGTATSVETPGEPNNADNLAMIGRINAGQLDYSILGSDISCATVLPLALSSLRSHINSSTIDINWSMASETNNDYFLIQRSKDQEVWQQTGRVNSQGNSSKEQNYTFTDQAPLTGIAYYRLVQVFQNGERLTSTVLTAKFAGAESGASVYPNPVLQNSFYLKTGNQIVKSILITDVSGKITYKDNREHTNETLLIPVKNWAKGIYFIRLNTDHGVQTIKISHD
ncbi:MAG TPA: T9SS type A sorting domain-containing protein [Arachidicoccus sp.]|nr:T9SS type A sorting domain-containing protein [Arachidicoccus sp.]